MATSRVGIADLDQAHLAKLHALEAELGSWIVALGPTVQVAELTEERLQKLQTLEDEIGVVLLACEPSS